MNEEKDGLLDLIARVRFDWDVDAAWRALRLRARAREATPPPPDVRRSHLLPLSIMEGAGGGNWLRWRIAAVALVACAILTGVVFLNGRRAAVQPLRSVATRRGQVATLRLSDGTRVELGVASTLRYAPTYGRSHRDVYLEGEAYFDVTPDVRRPFTVHTASAVTRDRGTKFDVRAYPGAGQVEVTVVEGSVDLNSVVLRPADLGQVDRDGRLRVEHGVDTAARLAWRAGRLVFHDTPLREALSQLNRWYDVELELGDSALGDYPLTASLHGEPLDKALDLIIAALDVRVARRGTATVLYRRPAAP